MQALNRDVPTESLEGSLFSVDSKSVIIETVKLAEEPHAKLPAVAAATGAAERKESKAAKGKQQQQAAAPSAVVAVRLYESHGGERDMQLTLLDSCINQPACLCRTVLDPLAVATEASRSALLAAVVAAVLS